MRAELAEAATGVRKPDLTLANVNLVNVLTEEVEEQVSISVYRGRVVYVGRSPPEAKLHVDAKGAYAIPGLIDSHIHIESSMLSVRRFAEAVLPHGTTAVFTDPHEIANVLGLSGVKLILEESEGIPLKVYVEVPSCVPAAPGLETYGAELTPGDVAKALGWERVVGLAEVMSYPAVIAGEPSVHEKIRAALSANLAVEGHAPSLTGRELAAYIASGVQSDHECTSGEEALEKARRGMWIEAREGSTMRNLASLLPELAKHPASLEQCTLASDDREVLDLLTKGHMDHVVNRAIELGLDPVKAVKLASLNPARRFRLDHEIGCIAPGRRADILLCTSLSPLRVEEVYADGKLVAKSGELAARIPEFKHPSYALNTIKAKLPAPELIAVKAGIDRGACKARVIEVKEGEAYTRMLVKELEVKAGLVQPSIEEDVLLATVVERHRASGSFSVGFVSGFRLERGAIASSIGHDSHNLTSVGADSASIHTALKAVAEMQGGLAVAEGSRVLARLQLKLAGLMSTDPPSKVADGLRRVLEAARQLGCEMDNPFMPLSFLPLPVIPEARLTDKGLVDARGLRIVPVVVEELPS